MLIFQKMYYLDRRPTIFKNMFILSCSGSTYIYKLRESFLRWYNSEWEAMLVMWYSINRGNCNNRAVSSFKIGSRSAACCTFRDWYLNSSCVQHGYLELEAKNVWSPKVSEALKHIHRDVLGGKSIHPCEFRRLIVAFYSANHTSTDAVNVQKLPPFLVTPNSPKKVGSFFLVTSIQYFFRNACPK